MVDSHDGRRYGNKRGDRPSEFWLLNEENEFIRRMEKLTFWVLNGEYGEIEKLMFLDKLREYSRKNEYAKALKQERV